MIVNRSPTNLREAQSNLCQFCQPSTSMVISLFLFLFFFEKKPQFFLNVVKFNRPFILKTQNTKKYVLCIFLNVHLNCAPVKRTQTVFRPQNAYRLTHFHRFYIFFVEFDRKYFSPNFVLQIFGKLAMFINIV